MNRVLFIDDEPNMLKTLRRQLSDEPYEPAFATSPEMGLALMQKNEYGVIVSDMRMPNMSGIEVLSEAKRICPRTRRVILTGYSEVTSVIDAINAARVHAFLVKPWDEKVLKAKIIDELTVYQNDKREAVRAEQLEVQAQQTQQQVKELKQLASHDALTGLHNRRSFETRLLQEWRLAAREHHNITLVMIDIDKFKLVNDTAGHDEGDRVLTALAHCLSDCMQRPSDFIARYGGEEFVAIIPKTKDPAVVGDRLRSEVEKLAIPHPAFSPPQVVTISVGVSVYNPLPSGTQKPGNLLFSADKAMYVSKQKGGNCVTLAPPLDDCPTIEMQ